MHYFRTLLFLLPIIFLVTPLSAQSSNLPDDTWFEQDSAGSTVIHFYFFWSNKCPHCLEAQPYLEFLADEQEGLQLHSYQLVGEQDNVKRFQLMMTALGRQLHSVPAFMFCNTVVTGYDAEITPPQIESLLNECREYIVENGNLSGFSPSESKDIQISIPFFGQIDSSIDSLPLITLVIAGVDAFNPCAFFVLMFLMSLMLHTRKRSRMLLVGGVFVFISGLMYFLFMAAWLNLFRAIGQLELITFVAALFALLVGLINVKDFVWFKKGVSLTISDSAKPALYQRARSLIQARSIFTMLVATAGLAFFANLYEFLCTAGFPMVYTRILTLSELTTFQYYLYLFLYNLIYIIPLLIIVILFTWTMGRRQLQETEGRHLKLISGLMMVALAMVLIIDPVLVQNLVATLLIFVAAISLAIIIIQIEKYLKRKNRSS